MYNRLDCAHDNIPLSRLFGIGLEGTFHTGILYSNENKWRVLHLGFDGLKDQDLERCTPFWTFANPDHVLHVWDREQLSNLAHSIAEGNAINDLYYGLSYYGEWFSDDGSLIEHEEGCGLTCSAFVLAVLDVYNFRLVDDKTWPNDRPEDQNFTSRVIKYLARNRGVEEVTQLVKDKFSFIRFRPVEILGSAISDSWPCDFNTAERNALSVTSFADQLMANGGNSLS